MPVSDFRINSRVRSCLARHWIDTQQVSFGSFRGIVRISGTLVFLGDRGLGARLQCDLTSLEEEIRRVDGVRTVHFDFTNCWKGSSGEWTLRESSSAAAPSVDDDNDDESRAPLILEVHERRQEPESTEARSSVHSNGPDPQRPREP